MSASELLRTAIFMALTGTLLVTTQAASSGKLPSQNALAATVTNELARIARTKEDRTAARDALVALGHDATAALVSHFESPEFTVRWEIANILGITRDAQGVPALVERVLRDTNPHIRWRSLWALREIDDPNTAERLTAALTAEDATLRWNGAVGAGLFGVREALPILQSGVGANDDYTAWEAVYCLAQMPDPSSLPALASAMGSKVERVRREAVQTLARHVRFEGVPGMLLDAIADPDAGVRMRAVRALPRGDAIVREALTARLAVEVDPEVRRELGRALGLSQLPPVPKVSTARDDRTDLTATIVAESESADVELAEFELADAELTDDLAGVESVAPAPAADALQATLRLEMLLAALRQRGELRKEARKLLTELGPDIVPRVLQDLNDEQWNYRWEIVTLLGTLEDPRAVPGLVERVVDDPNPHVRWRSLYAASACATDPSDPADRFAAALTTATGSRRWNAAVGLGYFSDDRGLEVIQTGLTDPDWWIRWEAVNSLKRIHDATTTATLVRILRTDPDERVAREAAMAIGSICQEGAENALIDALVDPRAQIRERAALSLTRCGSGAALPFLEDRLEAETAPTVREQLEAAIKSRRAAAGR